MESLKNAMNYSNKNENISGTGFYSLKTDILKKYILQTNILKQEEEVQGWKNMYSP